MEIKKSSVASIIMSSLEAKFNVKTSKLAWLLTNVILISLSVLYISISAQIAIPLWFTPVPITLQTFAVISSSITLGKWRGFAASSAYTILGLVGLPVFAGGKSGLQASTGYIFGLIFASYLVGYLASKGFDKTFFRSLFLVFLADLIIFGFGVVHLMNYLNISSLSIGFKMGIEPFLIVELIKNLTISAVIPVCWKIAQKLKK